VDSVYNTREFKEEITRKYFEMIYKLAFNQTKSRDNADDVVQEVFLRYIKNNVVFKSEEHIKAWLIRVTINCSKNIFTNSWFKRTEGLSEDISVSFETKEESDIYTATTELPKKYRAVIHLFYYEDMSVAEIAKCLNEKESTIKSQLHRARIMLKSKLKGGTGFVRKDV